MKKSIKRKQMNGFTLVELLAVIVILAIILVIAVPKVMSVIEDAKKATLESTAKMIASQAEKRKVQNAVLNKEEEITCENIAKLNDLDYKNCYIEFLNNTAYVTIIGSNKFEDMYVCKGTKNESKVVDRCPNERVSVTIDSAGGSVKDLSGIYKEGDVIELEEPVKENHKFLGWIKESGNGELNDNKFTVGSDNVVIKATWELNVFKLNVVLGNNGITTQKFETGYEVGSKIMLENPTRTGHTFDSWSVSGTNASIVDNVLTMGTEETTITANWEVRSYLINYELDDGMLDSSALISGTYGSTVEIINPTKEGYIFAGWDVMGEGAVLSGTNLTIGSSDITLTAIWHKLPTLDAGYPSDVTVSIGNEVTSNVLIAVDGDPTDYTYQWYENGNAISGATSSSYTFTPSDVSNTSIYCVVTTSAGTVTSRTATITANKKYSLIPGAGINGASYFSQTNGGTWYTTVNVTDYDKMIIKGTCSFDGYARVGLYSGVPGSSSNSYPAVGFSSRGSSSSPKMTINGTYDISSLTGNKYFGIYAKLIEGDTSAKSFSCSLTEVTFIDNPV